MATRPAVPIDPDAGIPDLIRRLVDDSKRLAENEVRLAKLELRERAHDATRAGIWLGIAAGAGVIALVALTVCLAALIGRLLGFHYWAGTLIVAVLELGVAALLVTRGLKTIKQQSLTLPATRQEASKTAEWAKTAGSQLADDVRDRERLLTGQTPTQITGQIGTTSSGSAGSNGARGSLARNVEIPIERRD